MKSFTLLRQFGLILLIALLAACVATPSKRENAVLSDGLLQRQMDAVEAGLNALPPDTPATVYLGFAMHSESLAFQGDVLLGLERFKAINPHTFPIILSNRKQFSGLDYPFATASTMQTVFEKLPAIVAGKNVNLVMLASTHGSPAQLSVHIDQHYPNITPAMLRNWLQPLTNKPQLIILSACYSGSFIPELREKNRIIMTAASATTNSFGCAYENKNTFFVEALLSEPINPAEPTRQWFNRTANKVAKKERDMRATPPSNPQLFLYN